MGIFKKKNEKTLAEKIFSIILLSALAFLIIFLSLSNVKMFKRRADLKAEIQDKKEEIVRISEKIQEAGLEEYSDDYSIEKVIREQLLMKKEGEEVVFITPTNEKIGEEEKNEEEEKFVWWNPFTWIAK